MEGAQARGASFAKADFRHALLANADLSDADLRDADFGWADHHRIVTDGARMDGSTTKGVRGTDRDRQQAETYWPQSAPAIPAAPKNPAGG